MALFNFGKNKAEKETASCCCSVEPKAAETTACCCDVEPKAAETTACCCGNTAYSIKVLGAGCKSCHDLLDASKAAVKNMGLPVEVEYVTDMEKIMEYGVMSMPALVVNDKVISMGKVLKASDVEKLLRKIGF